MPLDTLQWSHNSTSLDAMSLDKKKIIVAVLRCNHSIEQNKSELLHAPHNIRPYRRWLQKPLLVRTWIVSVSLTWSQRPWFPGRGIHASLWLTIKPSKCVFETHLRLEPPRTLEQKGTSDFLCWAAVLHFCQNGVSAGCFGTKYILHVKRYSTVQLPDKSFVNMLNNVRHNMEPRGMPVVTGSRSDQTPFNSVNCWLLFR